MAIASFAWLDDAYSDIRAALRKNHLATTLSWQDIAQRYHRSRVGAFWLTINMAVLVLALGLIFGTLFRVPMKEFFPYLCVGLIFWGFISQSLSEGCNSLISAQGIILQVRMPLFVHVLRTLYRNGITLAHNFVIYPLILLLSGSFPTFHALIAIPGFLLVAFNVLWMMLILSVLCARYRDMGQVMQNILQVMYYVTPLMWMPSTLPDTVSPLVMDLNPFYHLISLVRAPLLGQFPTIENWTFGIAFALVGWTVALLFFCRFRRRIPYWL